MTRVLILTPEFDGSGGGIMTFYQGLIPAIQAAGAEIRVIEGSAFHAAKDRSPRSYRGALVETLELDRLRRWEARFEQLDAVPGLRRYLAAAWAMWEQAGFGEDADIVEACDWGLLFAAPAIEAKRPLVVQCHGSIGQIAQHDAMAGEETQDALIRLLESAILSGTDCIQTSSLTNASHWREETGRDVVMIRPAWALPPAKPPREIGGRGLVVGRVQRWKGPQVVCEALRRLGLHAPKIEWIGRDVAWGARDGSTGAHLSKEFPDVWGNRIIHHDPVPNEDMHRLQAAALFNLAPSTWDVFNFTAVEAMASGRPTVVSTGAGASELIEDGVNGYLFRSGDAESLRSALDRVMGECPGRLVEIGRAAQETVRRELDPASVAARRLTAYQSAIDAFGGRKPLPLQPSVEGICRPKSRISGDAGAFLAQAPLRTLVRHVASRIGAKAGLRGPGGGAQ